MRDPAGRFHKGVSGNPGGRPAEVAGVREAARKFTTDAIQTLAHIMSDETAPHSARTAAAVALLDRGHGRPAQQTDLRVEAVDHQAAHLDAVMEIARRRRDEKAH